MMKLQTEKFIGVFPLPSTFLVQLDRMFARLYSQSEQIPFTERAYVDASAAAVSRYLPKIVDNAGKIYHYVKTDASANAVTIYPQAGDTIEGAASLTLPAQYSWVMLYPNAGVWYVQP